jgi:hypothetical protein
MFTRDQDTPGISSCISYPTHPNPELAEISWKMADELNTRGLLIGLAAAALAKLAAVVEVGPIQKWGSKLNIKFSNIHSMITKSSKYHIHICFEAELGVLSQSNTRVSPEKFHPTKNWKVFHDAQQVRSSVLFVTFKSTCKSDIHVQMDLARLIHVHVDCKLCSSNRFPFPTLIFHQWAFGTAPSKAAGCR